jgi:hypothetical protein
LTAEQWYPQPDGKPTLKLSLKIGLLGTALGIISAKAAMTLL